MRLIGREVELLRLRELFTAGHRLVTLTGPGGIGKTALARACAEWAGPGCPWDGVWTCELIDARGHEGLGEAVGRALQVPAAPGTSLAAVLAGLARSLAARGPCLLVLDGFEHLVEHASATVGQWVSAAPELRVLVTSREHLRIAGEVRLDVPPLSLPVDDLHVEGAGAVDLFVERVRALDPAFTVDVGNARAVAELARRLEGIPLAIELAASRLEIFGLAGLLDGLQARFDLLARTRRDDRGRAPTLRAAIDWSWSLLDPTERTVLALCTLFRGGFSAVAVQAVLGPVDATRPLLEVLHSLRDKSVLRSHAAEGLAGHVRFTMFAAIREFAAERLDDAALADQVRARHATFFLAAGEAWAAGVDGPGGPACLRNLALERDNLLRVHEDALAAVTADAGAAARTLRCALVLDALAAVQGPLAPQLELLERTLVATEHAEVAPQLRARTLRARGRARLLAGQATAALRDLERALVDAQGDPALRAAVLTDLGVYHHRQRRDPVAARGAYEQALALARVAYDRHTEARALGNLAALWHDQRALDPARVHYHGVLELVRELGNRRIEGVHVANLGVLEQECGHLERARAHFEAAIELLGALGERRHVAIVISNQATLDHEEGALEAARRGHERALALLREVGDAHSEALCLSRLGRVTAALGWIDEARACMSAAERLLSRIPDPVAQQAVHVDRGFIEIAEAAAGAPDRAAELLAAVRRRISDARAAPGQGEPPWIDRSDDIRSAVRLLERALATFGPQAPAVAERAEAALILGPDARWFRAPGEAVQDFQRRGALRRLLLGLVQRQREEPGVGLSLSELLAIGWPEERVIHKAGANRVYVALATLRQLGLRRHLLSRDDGYLLDPALAVIRAEEPPTA